MSKLGKDEIVKAIMKEIDESKIEKYNQISIPSFKIEDLNSELDTAKNQL